MGKILVQWAALSGVTKSLSNHVISYAKITITQWEGKQCSHEGVPTSCPPQYTPASLLFWLFFPLSSQFKLILIHLLQSPMSTVILITIVFQPDQEDTRDCKITLQMCFYRKDSVTQWLFCPHPTFYPKVILSITVACSPILSILRFPNFTGSEKLI